MAISEPVILERIASNNQRQESLGLLLLFAALLCGGWLAIQLLYPPADSLKLELPEQYRTLALQISITSMEMPFWPAIDASMLPVLNELRFHPHGHDCWLLQSPSLSFALQQMDNHQWQALWSPNTDLEHCHSPLWHPL